MKTCWKILDYCLGFGEKNSLEEFGLSEIVGIEKIQLLPLEKFKTLPGNQMLEGLVMELELLLKAQGNCYQQSDCSF